jgi:UrcA family protein
MTAIHRKSNSLRRTHARAVMLVGCVLAAAASLAQAAAPADDVPSVTVHFADLNVSTEEGSTRLYSRIATAARAVCERSDSRDPATFAARRACESAAIARAVSDVHSPRLAAVYAMRIKHG